MSASPFNKQAFTLTVPSRLARVLAREPTEHAQTETLFATSSAILLDNKLPFFPDYTDHGLSHVQGVLNTADALLSEQILDAQLIDPVDVTTLSTAIVLHDIAMHLREAGFVELIADGSPWIPLPWYRDENPNRAPDRPWSVLWDAFTAEARHFSNTALEDLLGPSHNGIPRVAFEVEDLDIAEWTTSDRLLIGEFLRRHHARLAHEIAIYGMPGVPDAFPRLPSGPLTDAAGAIARSHGEMLRIAFDYLAFCHERSPRPFGVVAHYLMAILRIADFLQMQADRAPDLLLHMRKPPSYASLHEWKKHEAVNRVDLKSQVSGSIYVEVMPGHSLLTHIGLEDMLVALQAELDSTNGALAEVYLSSPFHLLKLDHQRVDSNINKPAMRDSLSYIPVRARLRSSGDLFRLVVSDLYGPDPVVAGRELLQNAVDAVRLRWRSESSKGVGPSQSEIDDPVAVTVRLELSDEVARLEVIDKGIGMTPEIVTNYFLVAGASFGPNSVANEPRGFDGRWAKAGRFGIGALAGFLLGSSVRVETRPVSSPDGLVFDVPFTSEPVELTRSVDVLPGTRVAIDFPAQRLKDMQLSQEHDVGERFLREIARFYVLRRPRVHYELVRDGAVTVLQQDGLVPDADDQSIDGKWRRTMLSSGQELQWAVTKTAIRRRLIASGGAVTTNLAHNGFEIRPCDPRQANGRYGYRWRNPALVDVVAAPYVSVSDPQNSLPLTLDRFSLQGGALPFEREFAEAIADDVIAHSYAGVLERHPLGRRGWLHRVVGWDGWFLLSPGLARRFMQAGDPLWVLETRNPKLRAAFLADTTSKKDGHWRMAIDIPDRIGESVLYGNAAPRWPFVSHVYVRVLPEPNVRSESPTQGRPSDTAETVREIGGCAFRVRRRGDAAEHAELLDDLVASFAGDSSFALTLLRYGDESSDHWVEWDQFGQVWVRDVAGLMPNDPALRNEKARRLVRSRPEMGPLMEAWGWAST